MAKSAVIDPSPIAGLVLIGKHSSALKMKRKTPSELRNEQLKRTKVDSPSYKTIEKMPPPCSKSVLKNGVEKSESVKAPMYIDTRVDRVYPVRKTSDLLKLNGKEKIKDTVLKSDLDSLLPAKEDEKGFKKIEKCSQSLLRNVVEIHLGDEKPPSSTKIDMEKALKGLASLDKSSMIDSLTDVSGKNYDLPSTSTGKVFPEFHIPGQKAPLDFTLKTIFRLISSSSVKWCHRVNSTPSFFESAKLPSKYSYNMDQHSSLASGHSTNSETMFSEALHSWTFPQSSLPISIITAMTLSPTKGETDFLMRRQHDWEDSFRNLYYMLRKNLCSMFYVYTSQFIVLFLCNKSLGKKQSCNAYLSQSTRGLRSVLRNHDICFSMPFCQVDAEHANEADLAELSEIEMQKLGQVYHHDSISGVDNSPQSLLAFIGNTNVHGLYDFLLNYRYFLKSLSVTDVPALYAPIPFPNASLSIPEVRCKEIKRADALFPPQNSSDTDESDVSLSSSTSPICYSIEVKDDVLPPWVICRLCAAMSADGRSFESTFTTEPLSAGLNVALESLCRKPDQYGKLDDSLSESGDVLGLPEAALAPRLQSAYLRCLKYSKDSYLACVTQI